MQTARPKVLIVDDIPSNVEALGAVLEHEYELFFALNGEDALKLAAIHLPDIILLDVMMPNMDGFEVCRRLRQDRSLAATPVIFVTALVNVDDQLEGVELGAVDYIIKPINIYVVRLRVRNQLELKMLRDELILKNARLQEAYEKIKRLEALS